MIFPGSDNVDCRGPWMVGLKCKATWEEIEFKNHILSMVDAGINLIEFALIATISSETYARQFDINWLWIYPRQEEVGFNNGSEFIGENFEELLRSYDIKSKPTNVKKPTAQAETICVFHCVEKTTGRIL